MPRGIFKRRPETIEKLRQSHRKVRRDKSCKLCSCDLIQVGASRKYCEACRDLIKVKTGKNWKINNKEKNQAEHKILNEIRQGRMVKACELDCKNCNNKASEYHHPDYNKPLEVVPLCHSCHMSIHGGRN